MFVNFTYHADKMFSHAGLRLAGALLPNLIGE